MRPSARSNGGRTDPPPRSASRAACRQAARRGSLRRFRRRRLKCRNRSYFWLVTVWKAAPSRSAGMINVEFTDLLLGLLGLLLIVAAVIDVRTFTISNRLNVAVALLAPVYWWSIGLPLWPDAAIQVGIAVAVFV